MAGHHAGGREMDSLLGRTALPVDGGGRDLLGPTGGEHGLAPDVEALLPHLGDATPDHVLDQVGLGARPCHESLEDLGGEVDGMEPGQPAVAASNRRPHRSDDHGVAHNGSPGFTPAARRRSSVGSA